MIRSRQSVWLCKCDPLEKVLGKSKLREIMTLIGNGNTFSKQILMLWTLNSKKPCAHWEMKQTEMSYLRKILQDVSVLFLYRACCTKILFPAIFILVLTWKQSTLPILEFSCCKDNVNNTVRTKHNHKKHNLKSCSGETRISRETNCNSLFTLLIPCCCCCCCSNLPGESYLENSASSCFGCVLADVFPPSMWVILCFYG